MAKSNPGKKADPTDKVEVAEAEEKIVTSNGDVETLSTQAKSNNEVDMGNGTTLVNN